MDGFVAYLANTWPFLLALALVGLITYGALMPYVRAERRRRDKTESDNE